MKKFLIYLMFIVFLAQPCLGISPSIDNRKTYKHSYRFTGKAKDKFIRWCEAVEDALDGTDGVSSIYFSGLTTAIGELLTDAGTLYYDTDTSALRYYTSSWQDIGNTTSGSTLDQAYTAGQGISIDVAAMALTQGDTDWSTLTITSTAGSSYDNDCVVITTDQSGYTGDSLFIDGIAGSTDIRGDSWNMSQTGVLTFSNGEYIENVTTDDIFEFASDTEEDFRLDLSQTNEIGFSSGSSAITIEFNDLDRLAGVESITGDVSANFTISAANDGTYDVTVAQTGTGDNELRLASAGTATNALDIDASTGGIQVTAATQITLQSAAGLILIESSGGDITIDATDKSIKIDAGETSADDALVLTVGADSGIQITSFADIDIITTGTSGEDISITNTGGSILLSATEAAVNAISLQATAGAIDIDAIGGVDGDLTMNAGDDMTITAAGTLALVGTEVGTLTSPALTLGSVTTTASTTLRSGTGDLALTSTDDITLTVNTTTTDNITITNTPGTETGAIAITATVGGITHTSANCASTWTHTADGTADDLSFIVAGSFDASLVLTSSGTLGNAIDINTSAGGIDIDMAGGVGGEDFDILTATSINFKTTETAADQFKMDADGVHNGNVINLETTDGGILLNADGGDYGDITLDSADDIILTTAGKLTITNSEAVTVSGALTMAGTITVVGVVQIDQIVTNAENYSVLVANSGKIHLIGVLSQNTTIKLPGEADGLNYEFWFIGATADSDDHNITSEDTSKPFIGGVVWLNPSDAIATIYSDGVAASPGNYILTIPNMAVGTVVKMTCDGTNWYVTGTIVSDTTPTFTGS